MYSWSATFINQQQITMSHIDPLFDPENVLPEDIDGEEVDRLHDEESDDEAVNN